MIRALRTMLLPVALAVAIVAAIVVVAAAMAIWVLEGVMTLAGWWLMLVADMIDD